MSNLVRGVCVKFGKGWVYVSNLVRGVCVKFGKGCMCQIW